MALDGLHPQLRLQLEKLDAAGGRKGAERVVTGVVPAVGGCGPRWLLAGHGEKKFLRMNSNSYLGLGFHPDVLAAAEEAARIFGTGPGAVRFISGTYAPHLDLEARLAHFHGRQACMLFSAAYSAVMGVLPPLINDETAVLSDALNHNSIINAIRLARPAAKLVYRHLDMADLEARLKECRGQAKRLIVVTDGIFSMRGDSAPLAELTALCRTEEPHFPEGIITVVDDSHGVGAFGNTGRGVEEVCNARADILVATLGKAFGVNGGYVVTSRQVIDFLRESSPFYIYSNPISPAEAAAAARAVKLAAGDQGAQRLERLRHLTRRLTRGFKDLGLETIANDHPIVPLLTRDTERTNKLAKELFEAGILATGLAYPVVPRGDEEIRFQVSALHTETDIDLVLDTLASSLKKDERTA